MHVLSARSNFRNLPFVPFIPSRVLLEEPRVRRGCVHYTSSILYASPTHHHPPQNQPRPPYTCTLCSVWTLSSWPSSSFNSCFVYTLVRLRTPSYIGVALEGSTVDGGRDGDGDAERKEAKEEGEGKHEISRTKGGLLQYALVETRGYFKKSRFKKWIIIFSALILNLN